MALLAKDEGNGPREKPTPGMVDAVCVFVVDIGKHKSVGTYGEKIQHKIAICWEINELIKEGQYAGRPFMVSSKYTFTLFEKGNLSKMLEGWFSKKIPEETRKTGFDLEQLIGKRCTINLIESDDGKYINVGAVLPAQKSNVLVPVCTEQPAWIKKLVDSQIRDTPEAFADDPIRENESLDNFPF
jgi:hypothetical protein